MNFTKRDVGRLVFSQQEGFFAAGYPGGSLDDNPVLGAMMVLLQAEAGAGLDLNSLDFETRLFVDAVVPTPRAKNLAVQEMLVALPGA